jgi:hypothetical protein
MSIHEVLESEASLDTFVRDFEAGVFPVGRFKHDAHLALAACYLLAYSDEDAYRFARANIRRYNEAQGGKNTEDAGYHETITIFWLSMVRAALPAEMTRLDAVRATVELFAPRRDLFREYYSFDVLASREARAVWVAPDSCPDGGAFTKIAIGG